MKRYNITIDDDLAERMDNFIKKNHTNRSNLISISVSQYMDALEALPNIQLQLKELTSTLDEALKIK